MSEPVKGGASRCEPLPGWLAIVLVVVTSASVLVLEILAGRLLAPYVGVSLQTYTGIIGTVLAGIAAGAWTGGWCADRFDARRLLPVLLLVGGGLAMAVIPVVRVLGRSGTDGGIGRIVVLAGCGFLPVAAVLSAVPPAVVKLQLRDLDATGRTVGRLSAYSTAGAIGGTFFTGFVLVAWAAVSTLIVVVGAVLCAGGLVLWLLLTRRRVIDVAAASSVVALALVGVALVDPACGLQSAYYCVSVVAATDRPQGRALVMDDLRHSYVDLADPTYLAFWYTRRLVDAIDLHSPAGPLQIAYLGGGGFTLPRAMRAERPGSTQTVFEIDPALVGFVRDELGFVPGDDVDVVVGDARMGLRGIADDRFDVVVGDAFGSRAVPWHLTTEEFIAEIDRVLRPGGLYVANVIDEPGQRFLRAEAATVAAVLPHVMVVLGPQAAAGRLGNSVIVASGRPLDPAAVQQAMDDDGDGGLIVGDLAAFLAGATRLTDDFAPVDQLIAAGR